eukprot:3673483-Amphidinium_carterae.1
MTTAYAPLYAVFEWERGHPWLTNVDYIDYALKDLKKRQLFFHPDKIGGSEVEDHWPSDELLDSAKYMT